ncbi:MFS transporter [Bacillus spongiae]|uniref:MFS transporter n=1 Tax=Bacillus spongiae TaxID=2683610 RepID=A0ABU8HBW8_9BACI
MFRVFRHKAFSLFFVGYFISTIGNALFYLSVLWYVQLMTGEGKYVALLGLMITIPQLFMFVSGVVADRFSRRKVMLFTDVFSFIIVLFLSIYLAFFSYSFWVIAISFLLLNICHNLFMPASRAFMPLTLPEGELTVGNSLFVMVTRIGAIMAATAGAFLLTLVNETYFFLFNAMTFLISATFLLILKRFVNEQREMPSNQVPEGRFSLKGFLNDIKDGVRVIKNEKILLFMLPGVLLTNLFFVTFFYLTPSWSQQILKAGAKGYSLLELSLGLGALTGAFISGWISKWITPKLGLTTAFLLQSVIVFFPMFPYLYPGMVVLFIASVGTGMAGAFMMTMMQQIIPDDYRGRAFGLLMSVMGGIVPIGTILSGLLSSYIGLSGTFWISSVGCAGGAIMLAVTFATVPYQTGQTSNTVISN